ncbi:SPX domain-domain-containing protein [Catenaria anguillulae PL171]|uniref:SPX domain-domain-containing protein n=1 Tax=Catenaria anguillulae PL171 TaxID=765915 RepID=A0A1Y2HQG3_9FUNG|nr:SPX domain-domain-containing protein [Catenaria anguillulae PL171]
MKFGHTLETEATSLPDDYRAALLSYKTMKKLLKGIVREMHDRGLTPEVLRELLLERTEADPSIPISKDAVASLTHSDLAKALLKGQKLPPSANPAADSDSDVDSGTGSAPGSSCNPEAVPTIVISESEAEDGEPDDTASAADARDRSRSPPPRPSSSAGESLLPPPRTRRGSRPKVSYIVTSHTPTLDSTLASPTSPTRTCSPTVPTHESAAIVSTTALAEPDCDRALSPPPPPIALERVPTIEVTPAESSEAGPTGSTPLSEIGDPLTSAPHPAFESKLVITLDDDARERFMPILKPLHCQQTDDGALTVSLPSDAHFFEYLTTAVQNVSDFQQRHIADSFHSELNDVVKAIAELTKPTCRDHKRWRGIIKAWLDADMFMTITRKPKSVAEVAANLDKFQRAVGQALDQPGFNFENLSVHTAQLVPSSPSAGKQPTALSLPVYQQFLHLNAQLLGLNRFVDLNATAVRKILKKHAKRTMLPQRRRSIAQRESHGHMGVMYPPVRLPTCSHSLCYPCAYNLTMLAAIPTNPRDLPDSVPAQSLSLPPRVFLQRYPFAAKRQSPSDPHSPYATMHCPMCREDTGIHYHNVNAELAKAEDVKLGKDLKAWFPSEVKQKRREFAEKCSREDVEWAVTSLR